MKLPRPYRIVVVSMLATAAMAGGCNKKESPSEQEATAADAEASPGISFVPSEEDREAMAALVRRINQKTQRFPYADSSKKENAKRFMYLAATSEEPSVISASLQAMSSSYSHRSAQKETPDADFERVVLKHLQAQQPEIRGRALLAARVMLLQPETSPQLVDAIVALGERQQGGPERAAVLESLAAMRPQPPHPKVTELLRSSLKGDEPFVLTYALQGLQLRSAELKADADLPTRLLELSKHADPGVRGRSVQLLSNLASTENQEIVQRLRAALSDEHPYVRAEASQALGRMGHQPAVHELMPLLEDSNRSIYDLKGWTRLDGRPGVVRHRLPSAFVNDSAMQAIAKLSQDQLQLQKVPRKDAESVIAKNVSLTKAWYAKARQKIPRDELLPKEQPVAAAAPPSPAAAAKPNPAQATTAPPSPAAAAKPNPAQATTTQP